MIQMEKKHWIYIINKQMKINWYKERVKDIEDIEGWYNIFSTNDVKEKKFIRFLKRYLKKFLPKNLIEKEIWWIILSYWLIKKKCIKK